MNQKLLAFSLMHYLSTLLSFSSFLFFLLNSSTNTPLKTCFLSRRKTDCPLCLGAGCDQISVTEWSPCQHPKPTEVWGLSPMHMTLQKGMYLYLSEHVGLPHTLCVCVCVCPGEQSAPVFHWHSFCLLQLPETSVRDPAAGNENVPQRPPTTGSRTDSSCCDLRPSCCLHGGHTALRTAQSSDSKAACSWVTQDSPICQLSLQDFLAPWIDLCKAN